MLILGELLLQEEVLMVQNCLIINISYPNPEGLQESKKTCCISESSIEQALKSLKIIGMLGMKDDCTLANNKQYELKPKDDKNFQLTSEFPCIFSSHWKSGVIVSSTLRVDLVMGCTCTASSSLGN